MRKRQKKTAYQSISCLFKNLQMSDEKMNTLYITLENILNEIQTVYRCIGVFT